MAWEERSTGAGRAASALSGAGRAGLEGPDQRRAAGHVLVEVAGELRVPAEVPAQEFLEGRDPGTAADHQHRVHIGGPQFRVVQAGLHGQLCALQVLR